MKAFSYLPYRPADRHERTNRWRALAHAFDFRDLWKEMRAGWIYLISRIRGVETEPASRHVSGLLVSFTPFLLFFLALCSDTDTDVDVLSRSIILKS